MYDLKLFFLPPYPHPITDWIYIYFYCIAFLELYINKTIECILFDIWLLSLSIYVREICPCSAWQQFVSFCTWRNFLIHSCIHGIGVISSFGYDKAIMNICIQVFVWVCFHFSWINNDEWNCWVYGRYMLNFLRNYQTVSKLIVLLYISPRSVWEFCFYDVPVNTYYGQSFKF